MAESFHELIYRYLPKLPPRQAEIARFLLEKPNESFLMTVQELAETTGVGEATVIRLAQAMGFKGYHDLKQNLRHRYLASLQPSEVLGAHGGTLGAGSAESVRRMCRQNRANLETLVETLDDASLQTAVEMLVRARQRLVVGAGSHASIGLVLAHQAQFAGYPTTFENRGGAHLAQRLAVLGPEDLLVGHAFWRPARSMVRAFEVAHRYGIPSLAIVDNVFEPITRLARFTLVVPTESTSYFQSLTAAMALTEGLVAALAAYAPEHTAKAIRRTERIYEEVDTYYPGE